MLLYFRGCTAREKLNSISKATERILKIGKLSICPIEIYINNTNKINDKINLTLSLICFRINNS